MMAELSSILASLAHRRRALGVAVARLRALDVRAHVRE
eukprot:CAMPEP_0205948960 /NCGR_PEP_ID=MMETSP1459-20131121/1215_1 /ASSEMBLY_ACC=CAM_ASM_001120 /TAXON_ID=41880 /ORGANISM="Pycnococcus provasolii, Strain RCC931" /LENGTH=37 /DNA_ID= /DNA_START= /DNA_END= /DNA_ORIENTATION=